MNNLAVLDALLGSDFYYFVRKCFHTILPGKCLVPNWHLKAIAYQLKQIDRGATIGLVAKTRLYSNETIPGRIV